MTSRGYRSGVAVLVALAGAAGTPSSQNYVAAEFTAKIKRITDPSGAFTGALRVGQNLSGFYVYDTELTDRIPSPALGAYSCYRPPCGIIVRGSCGTTFQTFGSFADFQVAVGLGRDGSVYSVSGYASVSPPDPAGVEFVAIDLNLTDPGALFETDALLAAPPDLDLFDGPNDLGLSGLTEKGNFGVECKLLTHREIPVPLWSIPESGSVAAGFDASFFLDAGKDHAGDLYVMLGSTGPALPGFRAGCFQVPLEFDFYTDFLLRHPTSGFMPDAQGLLDNDGRAIAGASFPAGLPPSLAGVLSLNAYVVLDPGNLDILYVSNPTSIEFGA